MPLVQKENKIYITHEDNKFLEITNILNETYADSTCNCNYDVPLLQTQLN